MSSNAVAPKRTVELRLDEDLVRQAEQHSSDLSRTVEELLGRYVNSKQVPAHAEQEQLSQVIDFFNDLHARDGLLSDEFPNF